MTASAAQRLAVKGVGSTDTLPPAHVVPGQPRTRWAEQPGRQAAAQASFALVERAAAGDLEAYGELWRAYHHMVFRFVYFRVGNQMLAEDIASAAFLRALQRIGAFTWQGTDVGAWFVTIARNLVADHFKSARYTREVLTGDVAAGDDATAPEGSGPELATLAYLDNTVLGEAVKQLNDEQQECIALRFYCGLSVADTAREMGKDVGAIKALQYRAVRSLRRLLQGTSAGVR